jgi:uncharacterized membrane protein YfcA
MRAASFYGCMLAEITLLFSGFCISAVATMVGLGGGVFFVPLLVLAFGVPTQKATGISVLIMTLTTTLATIQYARQKRINYKIGVLLDVLDAPGAMLGAYLTSLIDPNWLAFMFGCLLLLISVLIIRNPYPTGKEDFNVYTVRLSLKVIFFSLLASFLSGVVAGMLGAGGGTIDETIMILALNMPVKVGSATSVFGMALTNFIAAISHIKLGNIIPAYAVPLAIGAIFGSQVGPYISKRVSERALRKILSGVFLIIAARMIIIPFI